MSGPGGSSTAGRLLTIDLGTTATKVALWSTAPPTGLVAVGRAEVPTARPAPGWAEQDPRHWLDSVATACRRLAEQMPDRSFPTVAALVLTGARQTIVPVTAVGEPIGPALLWSDHRAAAEADALTESPGSDEARRRTGHPVDAGAVAAKIAWLSVHDAERLARAAWLVSPRDLLAWHLTGELATEPTMASRSGVYDLGADDVILGPVIGALAGAGADRLPPVVATGSVLGPLLAARADDLGLPAGIPIVLGATDRASEALGAAATATSPVVSWGTTASVSAAWSSRPADLPYGLGLTRGAAGDWLVEAGLSSAGALLDWLARLTGESAADLADRAAAAPPMARGVLAVPWLDGARAPRWTSGARAGFAGLGAGHDAGDLARAAYEAVAMDVATVLDSLGSVGAELPQAITLSGGGARVAAWVEAVIGITGLPAIHRHSSEAASAGAALTGARALGLATGLDELDPVVAETRPTAGLVARYAGFTERARALADRLIDLPPRAAPET